MKKHIYVYYHLWFSLLVNYAIEDVPYWTYVRNDLSQDCDLLAVSLLLTWIKLSVTVLEANSRMQKGVPECQPGGSEIPYNFNLSVRCMRLASSKAQNFQTVAASKLKSRRAWFLSPETVTFLVRYAVLCNRNRTKSLPEP
jgi:hypothetical protein